MLFAPPTLASGPSRPVAPTAEKSAPVSGLGVFLPQIGSLGTAIRDVVTKTTACSGFHGWFAERQSVTFQAERKEFLGTVLLSPFKPLVRAAFHGWFTARPAGHFPTEKKSSFGTLAASVRHNTIACSGFHGWLAGQQSVIFQAERKEFLGTVLLSPFKPLVRAAFHGWFTARPAGHFPTEKKSSFGTLAASVRHNTTARSGFHGWFAERQSVTFMSAAPEEGGGSGYHVSVLPKETDDWMDAAEGKFIIDGTLGGGGHSEAFLKAGARVLGVDRDPEALAHATQRLSMYGDRFRTWQGNFADLGEHLEDQGGELADGLLLDLGVSSRQLDAPERGFSFRGEGPLDMRMGPATELTAAEVVNEWSEADLLKILWEYGEEPKARRIVAAITKRRAERPFTTTTDLADCIEKTVGRTGRTHPGTKTFQAIRIAVNDELGSLERALEASVKVLKPGGKLLVITFHSLEDRMVKRFMQDRSKVWLDQPDWPEPRPNPRRAFRLPQRKAIAPSDAEIRVNPRARSAKLRVAELLDPAQF